jgi:hypothetical protein
MTLYRSVVPVVIPYACDMSFILDFWRLNTIPLDFYKKIQEGGDIRVGRKSIFLPQKFKNTNFSNISSTF